MSQNIVKFLVRKGSDADRKLTFLAEGELGYTTDIGFTRLFVGDGASAGGWPVASKFFTVANWTSDTTTLGYIQLSDLLFVRSTGCLYALTGTNPTLSANYLQISQS
tara:strand:- start:4908 stop:5228 length:321 start_codon:yes stop_codon:yes gene_type:complete